MMSVLQLPVNELGVLLVLRNFNPALLASLLLHMLHELLLHFIQVYCTSIALPSVEN